MRRLLPLISVVLVVASMARGQIPPTPDNLPVQITSTGETTYENGIATARDNVAIHVGDTDIYADRATYNSSTRDVEVQGNVRIYRGTHLYVGESGIYNIDTKEIRARNMRGEYAPYFVAADEISVLSDNETIVKG
jgi:lipopolysaccharide assembly outer membrane protein LptD (OstA)